MDHEPNLPQLRQTPLFVAPYWADTDIRGTGEVFYRQTTNELLLAEVARDLQTAFPMYHNVTITNLLIVTWNAVGYYNMQTDKVSLLATKLQIA